MQGNAGKLKIRVRKGRWFMIALPALSFKFLKRICRLGIKFSGAGNRRGEMHRHESSNFYGKESWQRRFQMEGVDMQELMQDLNRFFDELAELEPFVLVEVSEETENVYVKIETV
jgi:hypothetical protein